MGFIKNLSYRAERYFCGERGIVENLLPMPRCCGNYYNEALDNLSNSENEEIVQIICESACDIPVKVKFRNPLGELVERICRNEWAITKYEIGDNYP